MNKIPSLCALLLCLVTLQACAIYGTATDERKTGTMSDDKIIATSIKSSLMNQSFSDGWDIAVYCYYGHVFLVGECPKDLRPKAIAIAKKREGSVSVTTHWFEPRADGNSDLIMSTKIRAALVGASNLNNTRIDFEVNANRVVLMGVAKSLEERKTAVRVVREVENVNTVTSYIMLPMRPGMKYTPTGITYQGFHPQKKAGNPPRADDKKQTGKDADKKVAPNASERDVNDQPGVDFGDNDPPWDSAPYGGISQDAI